MPPGVRSAVGVKVSPEGVGDRIAVIHTGGQASDSAGKSASLKLRGLHMGGKPDAIDIAIIRLRQIAEQRGTVGG